MEAHVDYTVPSISTKIDLHQYSTIARVTLRTTNNVISTELSPTN